VRRPRLEVADIFHRHGADWRRANAGHVSLGQLQVMSAIEDCRSAVLGGHVERCEDCGHRRISYNSCRNRHCPKCQGAAAQDWLAAREADLLTVGYFHVVFTLPAEIAPIAFQNKAVVYDLLFRTAAETLLTIAADPKHLGARIGATAVLHSWGSAMTHHPHLHMIVPGGGISLDGTRWVRCKPAFLLPVRVLSVQGLPPRRAGPTSHNDPRRRRVHQALPAPRATERLSPHPPLRAARQRRLQG
jgi:transposase-like zinc-binding protein/putative transposase